MGGERKVFVLGEGRFNGEGLYGECFGIIKIVYLKL